MAQSDVQALNKLIFQHGEIQISPQFLHALNRRKPEIFSPKGQLKPPDSGYQIYMTGYAGHVYKLEEEKEYSVQLRKSIDQLRALPRPDFGGHKLIGSVDTRMVVSPFFKIWYKIHSGQVLIFNIEAVDAVQRQRAILEKPALYTVRKVGPVWQLVGKTEHITTTYAAVNGQSNNLAKATWLMGLHLQAEFGKSKITEYTLFHNPSVGGVGDSWESLRDKLGFTTPVSKQFSMVLQSAQKNFEGDIKWVAHSQGGVIFAEGVRYFLNGNSSTALLGGANGLFKNKEKISLNKHSVAFHGNANNSYRSQFLLDRASIEVLAVRGNENDFVYNILGMNAACGWHVIRSVAYANHVFAGSVQQSPHTTLQDSKKFNQTMQYGPGKGRNALQRGVEQTEVFAVTHNVMGYIPNFLI
jgi:hypothetical protein